MKVQTQVSAKITLTSADMRQAIAEYIARNGFEIKADDLPNDFEGREFLFEAVEDSSATVLKDKAVVTPKRTASKPKAEPVKAGPEPEADTSGKLQEVIGSQVPDIEVALYREKKAAEAKAKAEAEQAAKAEAAANAFVEETVSAEPSDAHSDSLDDGDDELVEAGESTAVEEPKATPKKTTNVFADLEGDAEIKTKTKSVFDTEDEPVTATKKVTENLFA